MGTVKPKSLSPGVKRIQLSIVNSGIMIMDIPLHYSIIRKPIKKVNLGSKLYTLLLKIMARRSAAVETYTVILKIQE
jgi:hypothetical protein